MKGHIYNSTILSEKYNGGMKPGLYLTQVPKVVPNSKKVVDRKSKKTTVKQ
jgi:hypothetical protein